MQTAAYSALIERVIKATEALEANQAFFLPGECVVARGASGNLRFGSGTVGPPTWHRGDAIEQVREHVEALSAGRDYFASDFRRELEFRLDRLSQWTARVEDVGRRSFRIVYEPSERAWDAFHTLSCDYGEWEGRPYGAMDVACSDGRHLLITGAGEIRDLTAVAA